MAEFICFVKADMTKEAENKLKADFDVAAKQSITVRDASSLEIKTKQPGSFFYIRGSDEGIKRCQEILDEFVTKESDDVLGAAKKKIIEKEDAAASGFGSIFG